MMLMFNNVLINQYILLTMIKEIGKDKDWLVGVLGETRPICFDNISVDSMVDMDQQRDGSSRWYSNPAIMICT